MNYNLFMVLTKKTSLQRFCASFQRPRLGVWLALLVLLLAAGCVKWDGGRTTTYTPIPQFTALPSETNEPAQPPAPTAEWQRVRDAAAGVSFDLPSSYQPAGDGRWQGPEGEVRVALIETGGAGPGAICQGEANRGKPEQYGAYPLITDLEKDGLRACRIDPSEDQPASRAGEALFLLWYPADTRPGAALALWANHERLDGLVESLRLEGLPSVVITPEGGRAACDFDISGLQAVTRREGGLRIDEFPLSQSPDCSPYLQPEGYHERTLSGAPASREAAVVQSQWQTGRLGPLNARLAKFGYRVQTYRGATGNSLGRIMRNGEVLRANLSWIGQLSINTNGSDFILPVIDSYNAVTLMLRPDGIHGHEEWNLLLFDNVFPVLVGDDHLWLAYEYERYPRPHGSPALLQVLKNEQVVDTFSVNGGTPARGPVRGLWAWQNHWVMELPGLIVQDGEILNDVLGYPEMFGWQFLKEKPFYFFRQEGQIRMMYHEQPLSLSYDEIIFEPQWQMTMLVQMKTFATGRTFYARRGPVWYFVVLEVE